MDNERTKYTARGSSLPLSNTHTFHYNSIDAKTKEIEFHVFLKLSQFSIV